MSNKKILTIIIVILVLLLLGFVFTKYSQKNTQKTINPIPSPVQSIPTPTPISKPAPVTITTARGIIVAVDNKELTIKYQDVLQVFSLAVTKDFQKVTSGTVEAGDAKTVPSSISELKSGQEVLIIQNIGSTDARSVYIIK